MWISIIFTTIWFPLINWQRPQLYSVRCFNSCKALPPLQQDSFKTSYVFPNPKFSILLNSNSQIALQPQFQWRISPPTLLPKDPSLTLSLIWTDSYWVNSPVIVFSFPSFRSVHHISISFSLLLLTYLFYFGSALVTVTLILHPTMLNYVNKLKVWFDHHLNKLGLNAFSV